MTCSGKRVAFAVLLLGGAGAGLWYALSPVEKPLQKPVEVAKDTVQKPKRLPKDVGRRPKTVRPARQETVSGGAESTAVQTAHDDWIEALTGKDREIARKVSDALDEEKWDVIKGLVDDAAASANSEVRQQMVDALGWFGEKAMADLTRFLSDKDEDVAQSAFNHWDSAVDSVDDEHFKIAVARDALKTLANADMLDNVAAKLKGAEDEVAAVDAVVDVLHDVRADSPAAEAVKEAYEFITGEKFTTESEALLWKIRQKNKSDNQ